MILSPLAKFTFLLAVRKLGETVVMNIHAGEFPVNQSRRAEGGIYVSSGSFCWGINVYSFRFRPIHYKLLQCFISLFSAIFISEYLSASKHNSFMLSTVLFNIDHSHLVTTSIHLYKRKVTPLLKHIHVSSTDV